jgi:hypothetical protein
VGKRYEVSVLYGAQKTETKRDGNKARRKKKAMRNEVSGDTELCWCGCCGAIAGWLAGWRGEERGLRHAEWVGVCGLRS